MFASPLVFAAVIALVNSIVTAAMVASLNAVLTQRLERLRSDLGRSLEEQKAAAKHGYDLIAQADKSAREARLGTYADFWRAVADLINAQRTGDEDGAGDANARLIDAKGMILLHGSAEVVVALAQFWRGGAVLDQPDRMERFVALAREMRRDAGGAGAVSAEDSFVLLFGSEKGALDTPPSRTDVEA